MIWPAILLRRRVFAHLHGGGYYSFHSVQAVFYQRLLTHTLNQVNAVIVLGEPLKHQFLDAGVRADRLVVVRNGLSVGATPVEAKRLDSPIRILYLSNMMVSKGFLDVLEACNILNESAVAFECDFCGTFMSASAEDTAMDEPLFRKRIKEYGLQAQVRYRGPVAGAEKDALLRCAHVLVLPTYYPWEGQPLSIIEAMAHATPVVTTAHKGIVEQIDDGKNGCLVSPRAPEEIAEAIQHICKSEEHYRPMSEAALQKYRDCFTREKHIEAMWKVLCPDEQ